MHFEKKTQIANPSAKTKRKRKVTCFGLLDEDGHLLQELNTRKRQRVAIWVNEKRVFIGREEKAVPLRWWCREQTDRRQRFVAFVNDRGCVSVSQRCVPSLSTTTPIFGRCGWIRPLMTWRRVKNGDRVAGRLGGKGGWRCERRVRNHDTTSISVTENIRGRWIARYKSSDSCLLEVSEIGSKITVVVGGMQASIPTFCCCMKKVKRSDQIHF